MIQETKLWKKNALGIGTWRVYGGPTGVNHGQVIIAHTSTEGGSEVTHMDPVVTNKSGRSIELQLQLEIDARISRQLDKGYKRTREEALAGATNQLGLINPMLAQKITDVTLTASDFENGAFVQPKYDGHRCLIAKIDGDMLAYSRKGKAITTIGHILEDAHRWMQDGDTLDGELYIEGQSLQAIASYIKRNQVSSRALTFRWYDICDRTKSFGARYDEMFDLYHNVQDKAHLQLCPTGKVQTMSDVYKFFRRCREKGFEGAMLRLNKAGYQTNTRANQLLKVKERHDCEVTTVGCRESARGWAILRVRTDWGVEFDVAAPGSVEEKTEILQNYEAKYHRKRLTVEYANLTDEKVPFHCVATRWFVEV